MKPFILFLSIWSLLLPAVAVAQNPGMLGRTIIFSAGTDVHVSLSNNSTFDAQGAYVENAPIFGVRYRAEVGKTLSRGVEVGVQFARATYEPTGRVLDPQSANGSFATYVDALPLRVARQSLTVVGRFFPKRSGGIAPTGFYLRAGAGVETDQFTYYEEVEEYPALGEDFRLGVHYRLEAGLGYRYAVADKVLLELGFSTSFGRGETAIEGESVLSNSVRAAVDAQRTMDGMRLVLGACVAL